MGRMEAKSKYSCANSLAETTKPSDFMHRKPLAVAGAESRLNKAGKLKCFGAKV